QDQGRQPVEEHERDKGRSVALRLVVHPASEYRCWHGGDALEHANPAAYGGKMLATKEVSGQGPGDGINAIRERKQDDKDGYVPECTITVQQHTETQATQHDTQRADLLFGPAITQPPRQRPDDDSTKGHESHKKGSSGLV